MSNTNLICPITLELFEDPIALPCCGRCVSRQSLIQHFNVNRKTCIMCRADLSEFDPYTAARIIDLANIVSELELEDGNGSQNEEKNSKKIEKDEDEWKGTIKILSDKGLPLRKKIGKLELTNDSVKYKNLVVTVIDRSGSMRGAPMNQVKYSLSRITDLAYSKDNLLNTVITYDDRAESYMIDRNRPRHFYDKIFSELHDRGGTSFNVAFDEIIKTARLYTDDPNVGCMTIIFLTDGEDSKVPRNLRSKLVENLSCKLNEVWKKDVVLHSVGFGASHDFDFLNSLRSIGNKEGVYKYADPKEDDDILSAKINSILDVVAEVTSIPLKIISTKLEIISGCNGNFWVGLPQNLKEEDVNVMFSLGDSNFTVVPTVEESDELWLEWYVKLIDDIADELLMLSKKSSDLSLSNSKNLHLELLSRRANSIIIRLEENSASHTRLSSLIGTIESMKKGESVDKLKLNDIKSEGQFATNIVGYKKLLGVENKPKEFQKREQWITFKRKEGKRFRGTDSNFLALLGCGSSSSVVSSPLFDVKYLPEASSVGRISIVKSMIERNPKIVNVENKDGHTPLDLTLIYGYWKTFDVLFESGGVLTLDPQLMLRTCISKGYTNLASRLIKYSLAKIDEDMIKTVPTAEGLEWLTNHSDENITIENAMLKGCVDIVTEKLLIVEKVFWKDISEIFTKSTCEHLTIVENVLKSGKSDPSENFSLDENEITFPLFIAAEKGCLNMVQLLLKYLTIDEINKRNNKGTTALWIASCNRNTDIVYELLNSGADCNIANIKGDSPLIPCCQKGSETIVSLLLESGIDINLSNQNRDNAVLICCRTGQAKILEMLLNKYREMGDLSILDQYAEIDGFPPLLAATELNKVECIKVCVQFGANLNWTTKENNEVIAGATAMHLACHYGRLQAAIVLADLGCDLQARTTVEGLTSLHIAIKSGYSDIVRFLIQRDKKLLEIEDNNGRLPIYYASMQGREKIKEEFFTNRLQDILTNVIYFGEPECYDVLMNYSQSIGCYNHDDWINTKMNGGNSPLTLSLIYGNLQLADTLEKIGASLNVKDDYGITPKFWKFFLYKQNFADVQEQIERVKRIEQQSLQNKFIFNISSGHFPKNFIPSNTILEKRTVLDRMNDGYLLTTSGSAVTKIRNSTEPAILGFLEKLKNTKIFPEGKDILEILLWNSKIHVIKLIASGLCDLTPIQIMSIYLYTGNFNIFTNVNSNLDKHDGKNIWMPFITCFYQSILALPKLVSEVYRGVNTQFDDKKYFPGNTITWNSFVVTSKDWRPTTELIKENKGIIFIIKSKTGRDISRYSANPVDSEVIFLPGTSFMITSICRPDIIALGQANIRDKTYSATKYDINKANSGFASIIIELQEIENF